MVSAERKQASGPGIVVHTCNPTYSGGRDRRTTVPGRLGIKSQEESISKTSQACGTGLLSQLFGK
jgi:hypothetical protein